MRLGVILGTTLLAALPFGTAQAEPQILGLLAQAEPLDLVCEEGRCAVEVSAFCMEPDRDSPRHETAYRPFEGADLALVVRGADGTEIRLPAAVHARFESVRGYAAVRVSVPQSLLAEAGTGSLSLAIGERVSLMPEPLPTYRRPHEPIEIELATGARRDAGQAIVDRGGTPADAARLYDRLINALPARGQESAEARAGLWSVALKDVQLVGQAPEAAQLVREGLDYCAGKDPADSSYTLRQCLASRHDYQIWRLNSRYWASVGGS